VTRDPSPDPTHQGGPGTYLVIGGTPAARRVCASLESAGRVRHLVAPGDLDLVSAVSDGVRSAAVLVRDDAAALRYALALAHLDHSLALVVTIFDRTMADQLRAFLPQATVFSPAAMAGPSLAGPCLEAGLLACYTESNAVVEVRGVGEALLERRVALPRRTWRGRLAALVRWDHRHHDAGTRMLQLGLLGLAGILLADWAWLVLAEHHQLGVSFLDAARVVATVGPGPTDASSFYGVASALAMLATIVFTALFTAGLVDRLFEPRLLGLVGPRTAPRRDHVIVVGMGQLGVRLCAQLMSLDIAVVGVERDRSAPFLTLARQLGVPVFIGDGTERRVLEKLGLARCRALAAVGSEDLDNISVAVAASAVSPSTRVVLRAGEQEAIAETRSLLPLGVTRDVTEIAATFAVARLLGRDARGVVASDERLYLRLQSGGHEHLPVSRREDCPHSVATSGTTTPHQAGTGTRDS
jgi:Trk K+ transport system NAD-binding subunit